jgi:hypothetical protein
MATNMSDMREAVESLLQKCIGVFKQFTGTCANASQTIEKNKLGSGSALSASEQAKKSADAETYRRVSKVCGDAAEKAATVKAGDALGLGADKDSTPTRKQ